MATANVTRSVRGMKRFKQDTMLTDYQRLSVERVVSELQDGLIELRWGAYIGQDEVPYMVSHNGFIYAMVYKDGNVRY